MTIVNRFLGEKRFMKRLFFFARNHRTLIIFTALLSAVTITILVAPKVRWRAQVILLKATGRIQGVEWNDLAVFLLPGPESQGMERIVDTLNPYGVITNQRTTQLDLQAGAGLFGSRCSSCHGTEGKGGTVGPSLIGRELKHGESDWAIFRTIRHGLPGTIMLPNQLSSTEIWQILAYIRSLDGESTLASNAAPKFNAATTVNVPYQEILATSKPTADWLTYSGSYSGMRHSALTQINRGNVNKLAVKWVFQYEGTPSKIEASPIVRGGIMYVTVLSNQVMALDAANGKVIWNFRRKPSDISGDKPAAWNRGVAILDDKVFFGTSDAKLIALSAATGELLWQSTVEKDYQNYLITGAPLAFRDMVITGTATTTVGRGFIAAYDANTGKERWRFITVPGPNEPGNETWSGDSWQNGGAPTWLSGSYDPDEDLLFWGVGNPKPDYDTASRVGDNLYSNCVVALRGTTGELVWHFQFTPADDHDWDSTQIPILVDRPLKDGVAKQLLFANRNGFYYVLDRITGKFIGATPFVRQNWSDGMAANGRPIPRSHASANNKGILLYPGNGGATNWWSPSFDPALKLFFVPAVERGMVFFPNGNSAANSKKNFPKESSSRFFTAVRALDASHGKLIWEYRSKPKIDDSENGSLLSTDGGVIFGSDSSTFFALESATGKLLWSMETGGKIASPPVTFTANGEQLVVISAGRNLMAFALPK